MTFYEILDDLKLPCVYGAYKKNQPIPYVSYTGYGQDIFWASNGAYYRTNLYQLAYYYKEKDETKEDAIEKVLLDNNFGYDKSEDFYDDSNGIYYIVYSNIKSLNMERGE